MDDTTQQPGPGEPGWSNARAVRTPGAPVPARLRPGLTSTAGQAAATASADPDPSEAPAAAPKAPKAEKTAKRKKTTRA